MSRKLLTATSNCKKSLSEGRALIGAPAADRSLIGAPAEDRALIGAPAAVRNLSQSNSCTILTFLGSK